MLALFFFVLLAQPAFAVQAAFPIPQGSVNDYAGMLDVSSISEMENSISDFEKKTTIEIAVVTIASFEPYSSLDEYANELFKAWKIGKAKDNNGLLLIAARNEKRFRIEVGYGLEEFIPDGLAGEIIRTQIQPYFKQGAYGFGMRHGVNSVIRVLAQKKGIALDTAQQKGKKSILDSPILFNGVVFILLLLFIISRIFFPFYSRRNGSGGFWGSGGGGFGGGFGGFGGSGSGGGFGGFGGGGSGGGGAGGNWIL